MGTESPPRQVVPSFFSLVCLPIQWALGMGFGFACALIAFIGIPGDLAGIYERGLAILAIAMLVSIPIAWWFQYKEKRDQAIAFGELHDRVAGVGEGVTEHIDLKHDVVLEAIRSQKPSDRTRLVTDLMRVADELSIHLKYHETRMLTRLWEVDGPPKSPPSISKDGIAVIKQTNHELVDAFNSEFRPEIEKLLERAEPYDLNEFDETKGLVSNVVASGNVEAIPALITSLAGGLAHDWNDDLHDLAPAPPVVSTPERTLLGLAADLRTFRAANRGAYPLDDTELSPATVKQYDDLFQVRLAGAMRLMEPFGYNDPRTTEIAMGPKNMGDVMLTATMLTAIAAHVK